MFAAHDLGSQIFGDLSMQVLLGKHAERFRTLCYRVAHYLIICIPICLNVSPFISRSLLTREFPRAGRMDNDLRYLYQDLNTPAPINHEGLASRECGLIGGQIQGSGSDLLWLPQSPHWLTRDKAGPHRVDVALTRNPVIQRWRLDRSRTQSITTDATRDKVGRNRLGESNDGSFGSGIDKPVGRTLQARYDRRHVDNASSPGSDHPRQKCATGSKHRSDVQVKREVPILLRAIEDTALMNVPRAIEQDVERAHFKGKRIDSIRIRYVENTNLDAELLGFECIKGNLVDVRRPYRGTSLSKTKSGRSSDSLSRSGNESSFAIKNS